MVRDHGLEITLFQPFRDFEGLPEPQRTRAFDRAERKFDLMQELGTSLGDLQEVMVVYSSPGVVAEKVHLFSATYNPSRRSGPGGGLAEEGEEIEVLELPLDKAWAMVKRREIMDAKTVLLLQHLLPRQR